MMANNGQTVLSTLLGLVVAFLCAGFIGGGKNAEAAQLRTANLLAINDVYRLTGPDRGAGGGGLARVRALRAKLEKSDPDLIMLHAGDFLSPSFLGKTYKGEAMVDLMNLLDGNPRPNSFDQRMFVVFGNHEFDNTHCRKRGPLAARIRESGFTYLASNIEFQKAERAGAACKGLHDVARLLPAPNIAPYKIVKAGGLRLGLYGLTIERDKYKAVMVSSPNRKSCEMVRKLRSLGVDAVIAVTHLNWQTDLSLLGLDLAGRPLKDSVCKDYPDVIVGGHDHVQMALPKNGNPRIFKADADAVSANQITISVDERKNVTVQGINHRLDGLHASDATLLSRATQWFTRHDETFCQAKCRKSSGKSLSECKLRARAGSCLTEQIAVLGGILDAEEIKNRTQETGFGNWFMDRIRTASGADVAIFNAGGIRLNYDIGAGQPVTRRHLVEMFPFSNQMVVATVPAGQLWNAVDHGFATPGEGSWLHFSGLAASRHQDGRLKKLILLSGNRQGRELTRDSTEIVTVASNAFVLANGDNHGIHLCRPNATACIIEKFADKWPASLTHDPSELVEKFMKQDSGNGALSFTIDGRICTAAQTPCLINRIRISK